MDTPAVGEAQTMEPNNDDATPGKGDQQPSRTRGDPVEWSAIEPYRDQTPPGYDDEWTISTISRRFKHGQHAGDVIESPNGEAISLDEPHWYVTVRRDRYPNTRGVTADHEHHAFPDVAALEAWFEGR